ncbi:MAG: hypothetical protein HY996_03770 [Micrococcales bacterium]|nr:hypothetical protein [Micrococcales bacterium]
MTATPPGARRLPWWAAVLLVFVASRVVTTVILLIFASVQSANAFSGAQPSYGQLGIYWDGIWYQQIAFFGYPRELPRDAAGNVTENAWAFLPLYAWLSQGVSLVTRLPYAVAAIAVSVLSSAGAALLFHRMLSLRLSPGAALWGVTLFCFAPLSPILQVGYAEPLQLLLLMAALLLVMQRRYLWTLPLILVMGFTRPTGLAFALFLGLHLVQRVLARRTEPLPRGQILQILGAGAASVAVGFAWSAIAAVVTGDLRAYMDTELAWRSGYIGQSDLIPFTPWFLAADFGVRFATGAARPLSLVVGALLVLAGVVVLTLILLSRAVRRLGPELRLWSLSYAVYLLAVFFPQSSTFRLLMPLFPVLGAVQPRHPLARAGVLTLCVALQVAWVAACWWVVAPDWSPP